ncbi:hypothetical protein [Bradyrhizobium japonicum]|uniref:hypothetical protein n=1 Tax=Bradyrhizobium japonicum TaxID=375 RepID=UPI001E425711|nr:hypothetical protein [Bradyrhizobium japonicum]MCD9825337.1 hypothetical protein [Bradyrhizobium japonicum]MCD9898314.1 hypothetical protein [Bradyrhizobium japonicum]MCP1766102.1 hypothetical protein [Bradyrhizobium japonicum]MCP1788240.1 hypothetical protein [Bradyrhizobium japonicum]MCP1810115.1 hypothetical protein [Bradyrhizobium japonicum]
MSTLSQLIAQRAAAGAAYASAVDALKTAYINLAALDRTLENRNVSAPVPSVVFGPIPNGGPVPVLSFLRDKNAVDDLVRLLQHAEFAPSLKQDWPVQIITASNAQVASFTAG